MPSLFHRQRVSSLEAMHAFARALTRTLAQGDVILLEGELGAGKSELARAVIRAWVGSRIDVPSPTFTLVQRYEGGDCPITHVDLYRIGGPDELVELGLDEAGDRGVLIVEWPSRAGDGWFPPSALSIKIADVGGQSRTLQISSPDEGWGHRLAKLLDSR